MKFEVSRKDLNDALGFVGSTPNPRAPWQLLGTLRLQAGDSQLTLLGCDGELWTERRILANVSEPGSACIHARLFVELISQLPDGQLLFELEDSSLHMHQGASDWRMMALPADEFPDPPDVTNDSVIELSMSELREAVDGVSYAVSDETNGRAVLSGVLLTYDGSRLTLVATDTHRLAVLKLDRPGLGANVSAIVPDKALRAIKSLPLPDGEKVSVRFDEAKLGVDAGNSRVVSQLLAGNYPNWERVVPSDFTRSWTADRTELIENVRRARILAKDNANRVRFSGKSDQILISARSEDKGEAKEEVPAVTKNGEIDIAFNCQYVIDALNAMKGDGVRVELTEASRAAIFRGVEDGDRRFCVIMPMALG